MKLEKSFYTRQDVVQIAGELIGKVVFTNFEDGITAGIITETEAYEGVTDRASHAFGGKRTRRTEVMYFGGGVAYVYLCYGIHSLFNVVTNREDVPHAVLIRGIFPLEGHEIMIKRSKKQLLKPGGGIGPGNVSKLLGIHYTHSGLDLTGDKMWLEDIGLNLNDLIRVGKRIGIDYAGPDAMLPFRFWVPQEKIRI